MGSLQTKSKRNKLLMGISVIMLFFSFAFFSYSISDLSLAEEGDEYEDEETLGMINLDDYVVLTGVANTVEYLTALYLYVDDPYSATSVVLRYDSGLNALVLNSSIDANALGIGYNDFSEGVAGSVFVGGSGNKLNMNSMSILDEYGDWTGSKNGKNDSSVVIGGERNTAGQIGTVVIGGKDVRLNATNSFAVIGSNKVNVDNSSAAVVLGGKNVSFGQGAGHGFYAGNNLRGGYSNYLIGSGIDAQSAQHYSLNLGNTFAWSSAVSGLAIKGGGLGGQKGFYVNTENGLGLNTSTPRLTFDARSGGPLRLKDSRGIVDKEMAFDGDKILCDDEKQNGKFRGTVVYVQLQDENNKFVTAGFCGCNGKAWTPLSNDTITQYVCTNINSGDRKENCLGAENLNNAIIHTGTEGYQRWDEEANGGSGDWVKLNWTFGGVPGLLSGMQRECVYSCKVGYHPNTKSPQGWFTGDCVACTPILNGVFISPGTGLDDCQFACNAGYKYNGWVAPDERANKGCAPCNYGEWTTGMNQSIMCERCEYPVGVSARLKNSDGTPMKFYSGSMWDAVAKTGTGDPYFRGFTSKSTSGKYGCNFDCASGFIYSFGGSEGSNTCTECGTGTYSDGGQSTSCSSCTNKPMGLISFSWTDISGIFHSSQNNVIEEKDVAWYTSKGLTGAKSCEWTCNPTIGLVKVKDGDSWKCQCPEGMHLEKWGGKAQCVSNKKDVACEGELGEYAIRGPHIFTGAEGIGSWISFTRERKYWTYKDVDDPSELKACEWTCPHGYQKDGESNNCRPILLGKCSDINGTIVPSNYSSAFWDNSSNLCSKVVAGGNLNVSKIHINYYDKKRNPQFQFYPQSTPRTVPTSPTTNKIKYLVSWTCEGYEHDPEFSASCYAYWAGPEAEGKCDNNKTLNGEAITGCATDFSNCNDNKSCPPVRDVKTISNGHGKTWVCPGVFGGKQSALCHSCDDEYEWKTDLNGQGRCVSDKDMGKCEGDYPSNTDNMSFGDDTFVIPFDAEKNDYTPATLPYVLKASTKNLSPCEYACNTGYTWSYAGQKCMLLSEEYDCEDRPTNTAHIIFGPEKYPLVFTEGGYVQLTKKIFTYVGDEKTDNLLSCEFICDEGYYWDKNSQSCEGYDPVEVPPKCGSVSEDCPEYKSCIAEETRLKEECVSNCKIQYPCGSVDDCDDKYPCGSVDDCDDAENYTGCMDDYNICVSGYNECVSDYNECVGYRSDCMDGCNDIDNNCGTCEEHIVLYVTGACEEPGILRGGVSGVSRISANKYNWSCYTVNKDKDGNDYEVTISCGQDAPEYYYCDDYHYEFGNAHPIGKRFFTSEPSTTANVLYANDGEAAGKSCAFACNEGFSLIDNTCKMCKEGVLTEVDGGLVCTTMLNKCPQDMTWDEKINGCIPFGNCLRGYNYDNSLPEHAVIPGFADDPDLIIHFRPFGAGKTLDRQCHNDPSEVSPNTCTFTCEPGYYCSEGRSSAKCVTGPFKCTSSEHINGDNAFIFKNPTVNTKTKDYLFTYFEYIDKRFESQEEFESYANNVGTYKGEGCYYACKSGYFYATSAPNSPWEGCYSNIEMNAYTCSDQYPNAGGYIEKTKKPKENGQAWKYYEKYEDYEKYKSDGCAWTCQKGTTAYNVNGKTVCLKDCPEGKVFKIYDFYGGGCYSCDEGTVPDESDLLLGIVPQSCKDLCADYPDTFRSPAVGACVSNQVVDPGNHGPGNGPGPGNDPDDPDGGSTTSNVCEKINPNWKTVYISGEWRCIVGVPVE